MQYTYVGVDSHKDSHTAVFIDCFFEKLGELVFLNLPSVFGKFLEDARRFQAEGTQLMFALEDAGAYGRTLAVFLKQNGLPAKHVNSLLVAHERMNRTSVEKTDSVDAECAARVLLSKFGELPDADPDDTHWALRSLVARRRILVNHNAIVKKYLHSLLTHHYPGYRNFFAHISGDTSLAFFMRYPSPSTLKGTTVEELDEFLRDASGKHISRERAGEILGSLQDTTVQHQEIRDMIVQSTIRQIRHNMEEIELIEGSMASFLAKFNCTLTSMKCIDVVTASQIIACIGDIRRFKTSAKLARYAGIAPVTHASGKRDLQFASQRGNRELNRVIYSLASRLVIPNGPTRMIMNSFFYDYFQRKLSEGKTRQQALKCLQRRLVNIIWTMLTYGEEYVNPPYYELPDEEEDAKMGKQPSKDSSSMAATYATMKDPQDPSLGKQSKQKRAQENV